MDLNDLPRKYEWSFRKDLLLVKNIAWLPIARVQDKNVDIYLDIRMSKQILCLLKYLMSTKYKIFFLSPLLANPKFSITDEEALDHNMENYLTNYSQPQFYDGFQKLGFDFIENFIEFCDKEKSKYLIKDIYIKVNSKVQSSYYDYYQNKSIFLVEREDIRDAFNSLYREIQIYQLLK
jgi:hypothetical protein